MSELTEDTPGLLRAALEVEAEVTALSASALKQIADEWQRRAERMTPVVEAAKAWRANAAPRDWHHLNPAIGPTVGALIDAVDAYNAGEADDDTPEHGFDEASVLNPVTGKPYGPGPLWAGTEPMDYPDPRCHCGELWDTELDRCTGLTNIVSRAAALPLDEEPDPHPAWLIDLINVVRQTQEDDSTPCPRGECDEEGCDWCAWQAVIDTIPRHLLRAANRKLLGRTTSAGAGHTNTSEERLFTMSEAMQKLGVKAKEPK